MQGGRSKICSAYLKTIDNGRDDLAVRRIINVPKRGIGLTTINTDPGIGVQQEKSDFMRRFWDWI